MPAVKAARPTDVFARGEWAALTNVSRWKGTALVIHAWAVIFAAIAFAVWMSHWLAWIAAIIIIGGRQLGLAILMHDAAHGHMHPKRRINNFLGQWLTGVPVGTDLHAYRTYHLTHHRYTQQPEDPDLGLSAPFPVTRSSMIRKVLRDLTGLTFLKQRGAQMLMALKGISPGAKEQNVFIGKTFLKFLAAQLVLLTLSFASGYGALPYLLWLGSLATTFQLFLRIRNIAEHACTETGSEDPFSHARTTRAGPLAQTMVAPYWVNYHSEHHLFMGVPCYNLKTAHRMLGEKDRHKDMIIAPGYAAVLREVTVKPS
ncbi:fatty acid desaturase family protein [Sphingorhabdus sp. Alg239-R122]|uniref:fatty acid desaturase family protein n=1 Tax=Sphingorhabdus sp. Alg239-R122 TaxID=2305989 RepID=UPI0013DCC603|nr:fatty acid desaturase family protein [Sphingorhabdus sp. Alg239-R122]